MTTKPELVQEATEFKATPEIITAMEEFAAFKEDTQKRGEVLHKKLWGLIADVYPETIDGEWTYNRKVHTITKDEEKDDFASTILAALNEATRG